LSSLSPTQGDVQTALGSFIADVTGLVVGQTIISGQNNRTPEPAAGAFVVMTPIRFTRLETNLDAYADCKFTGSISGSTLTVTAVQDGEIELGSTIFGAGVAAGTVVQAFGTGSGGTGTYTVSGSQTIASGTLSAGTWELTQGAEIVVQLDFHSADLTASDLAQAVSTAFRDDYGTTFFAGLAPPLNGIAPLYADDPKQLPFINEAEQYEWRWVLEAKLQVNQAVTFPLQFFDSATVTPLDVDVVFPD
jgi:hypothetical protein